MEVTFDHLRHQAVDGSTACRNELERLAAIPLSVERLLDSLNLASNPANAVAQFAFVPNRVSRVCPPMRVSTSIPPMGIVFRRHSSIASFESRPPPWCDFGTPLSTRSQRSLNCCKIPGLMTSGRTKQRRWIAALMGIALIAAAALPHHHSDKQQELREYLGEGPTASYHEVSCKTTSETHWHPDRVLAPEPCLACLLRHLVGIRVYAPTQPILRSVEVLFTSPNRFPAGEFRLTPSSRGPPTLL